MSLVLSLSYHNIINRPVSASYASAQCTVAVAVI